MKTENQNNVLDYSREILHLLLKNAAFGFEINLITDRCQETLILICLQFILLRKLCKFLEKEEILQKCKQKLFSNDFEHYEEELER